MGGPAPPTSEVPVGELDLIVGVLSAKFPGHTSAHVRDVVYETHRRPSAAARIHAHLIPLMLNLFSITTEQALAPSRVDPTVGTDRDGHGDPLATIGMAVVFDVTNGFHDSANPWPHWRRPAPRHPCRRSRWRLQATSLGHC